LDERISAALRFPSGIDPGDNDPPPPRLR
jgi:hypothetical protein